MKEENDMYFNNPDQIQMLKILKCFHAQKLFMPEIIAQLFPLNRLSQQSY